MKSKQFIQELINNAINGIPLSELQEFIYDYLNPVLIPHVVSNHKHLTRCSYIKPNEVITVKNVSRCSYNPIKKEIRLQRCNYDEQQVFYACIPHESKETNSSLTALMETSFEYITNIDEMESFFIISKWHITRPLNLYMLPAHPISVEKNIDFKVLFNGIKKSINEKFNSLDEINEYCELLRSICDIFVQRHNKTTYYRISSAFYNALLLLSKEKNFKMDGLIYPSANTGGVGMNVVLKKDLKDEKQIQCDEVSLHSMRRDTSDPYKVKFSAISEVTIPDEVGNFTFEIIEFDDTSPFNNSFRFVY